MAGRREVSWHSLRPHVRPDQGADTLPRVYQRRQLHGTWPYRQIYSAVPISIFCLFEATGDTSWQMGALETGTTKKLSGKGRSSDPAWASSWCREDIESERGQEGARGHTASLRMQTRAGVRHLSAPLGQLGPPGLSSPPSPSQKGEMFLDPRQKNVKPKSEP